ncbi:YbaK/EbsC family protein [Candidatus Curtissbacteria bacterium]|nr:YbaK/EbsC family protein [Candidatus Curtissbacteria bacterium]
MASLVQIEKFLLSKNIPYKIIDLGGEVFRVDEVVRVGINPDEILKTLVVRFEKDTIKGMQKKYAALALRGKDRLDFKKVRRVFGGKATLASADEVLEIAGVPIGAVCPIGIGVPVYFDEKAMKLELVNMGSGDLTKGLDMTFKDLLKVIADYKIIDVSQ